MIKHPLALLPLLAVLACNGEEPIDDTGEDTDTDNGNEELTGQDGSIVVVHWPADSRAEEDSTARALFLPNDNGVINLAECMIIGEACLDSLPSEDSFTSEPADTSWFDTASLIDAGSSITVGGFSLPITTTQAGDPFYEGFAGAFPSGPQGLMLDGDLMAYEGTDDFEFAGPIGLTAPNPLQDVAVSGGDTVDLAWTTGGAGDVVMSIDSRVYHLADDGAFSLSIDDFEWLQPWDVRSLLLSRVNNVLVDAGGNDVRVQSMDQQWLYLVYEDFTGWTESTEVSDTCAGALVASPGRYYGSMAGWNNDIALENEDEDTPEVENDITGWNTHDVDGFVGVGFHANRMISATFTNFDGDSSVYLMSDCDDVASMVAGADNTDGFGAETVDFVAQSDGLLYVGLDGYLADDADSTADRFSLELVVSDLLPEISDTCAGATTAATAGNYYGDNASGTSEIDLGDGNVHTGYATEGNDSFVRIDLDAGETLTASQRLLEFDAALYLMTDCADIASVVAASDATLTGDLEALSYTASSAETVYLVLDAWIPDDATELGGQFRLDIEVE